MFSGCATHSLGSVVGCGVLRSCRIRFRVGSWSLMLEQVVGVWGWHLHESHLVEWHVIEVFVAGDVSVGDFVEWCGENGVGVADEHVGLFGVDDHEPCGFVVGEEFGFAVGNVDGGEWECVVVPAGANFDFAV